MPPPAPAYPTTYVYDAKGQLARENNQAANKTWVYTYDNGGNITAKTEYAYTTGTLGTALSTKTYTYGDSEWKDLLTAYNGATRSYDAIGNLTGDGTWTYTWQHGRQLAGMSKSGTTISYAYNADGQRISKTVNGTTTQYHYAGGKLARLVKGSSSLSFVYDSLGPVAVLYNDSTYYYYLRNAQGDVVGIVDAGGNQVVSYTYDAWGNVLSTTGSMASTLGALNPLRYRGYVYDTETGLYYLNSRYYNPSWGRFINADIFVSTGQGVLGSNMFAYCLNNPVMNSDPNGTFATAIHKLIEYRLAHILVQKDCARKYGWAMEVYVNGPKGRGFLDLLDTVNNEFYEVKSGRVPKMICEGQMAKYKVATIANSKGNQKKVFESNIGETLTVGTMTGISGEIPFGDNRKIVYKSSKEVAGLIVYDIVSPEQSTVRDAVTQPAPASPGQRSSIVPIIPFFIPIPAGGGGWRPYSTLANAFA